MSREMVIKSMMADWQVAPGCHQISNYDDASIKYRQDVTDIISSIPFKSLKRFTFVTISTNVLCADLTSSVTLANPHIDPIDRDIYLPLEISLTKSSVTEIAKDREERTVKTLYFLINPGPPPPNGSVKWAKDHKENNHKIDYEKFRPNDKYVETDIKKIIKEINAFLTPERVVYSIDLKHCRQDLGSLKWLNREAGYTMKPVKVFSIEDLYIVLNRRMYPRISQGDHICLGVARFKFELSSDTYDPELQCDYHRDKLLEDSEATTRFCTKAVALCWTHALLDEIFNSKELEEEIEVIERNESSTSPGDGH